MDSSLKRRAFLGGIVPTVALAGNSFGQGKANTENKEAPIFPGLITREKEPVNLEFPFAALANRITPNNQFFVRSHFPFPQLDSRTWQLSISGNVKNQINFTLDEIKSLPSKTIMATLECAGNGRAKLAPKVKGLLWEQGAVGNAQWTGVQLSVLLEKAGLNPDVVEIILQGADKGEITEEPKSPGQINFARSLPLDKARSQDVLIAYQMNGKDLSIEHGYPVRAVVAGWYGMASVKWLSKIIATNKPFEGYWQTVEYAYWKKTNDLPTLTAVTRVEIKAEISRPMLHEVVAKGKPYRVFGAAWCGEQQVSKVEIRIGESGMWQDVKLLDSHVPNSWRLWEYRWQVPSQPGKVEIAVRATDANGQSQPQQHDKDRRTYMVNLITPFQVEIG